VLDLLGNIVSLGTNMSQVRKVLFGFLVIAILCGLFIIWFPNMRGQYRFKKLASSITVGMPRARVLQIAESTGYMAHYVWPRGSTPGESPGLEMITDEYNLRAYMLPSVVSISYDDEGRVEEVRVDQ